MGAGRKQGVLQVGAREEIGGGAYLFWSLAGKRRRRCCEDEEGATEGGELSCLSVTRPVVAHRSDPTKSSGLCSSTSSSHVAASSPIPAGRSGDGREGIVNSGESNNPGPLLLQLQSTTRDWQLRSAIGVRSPLSAAERM
ncbi:hypothetical protein MRB53_013879 [Persea americana]|uniref:Uncharacterized protein n=1 Tax=Persea americana TaxID=3435 RepID=A0ACC2K986_PERAE|nr:hypothetical protein MRB53_013879 [Persea americana]